MWVPGFSGNDTFDPGQVADGTVNFAVWQTGAGASWVTELGLTGLITPLGDSNPSTVAGFENDKFVYFYQVINTGTSNEQLDSLFVQIDDVASKIRGIGGVNGHVFNEPPSVGPSGNVLGGDPAGFVAEASAENITNGVKNAISFPGSGGTKSTLRFDFTGLLPGEFTSVMFFTSNVAPAFVDGALQDGATTFGSVPAPTPAPEPGSMALIALGLPLIGARCVRRFRRGAAEATA